MSCLISVIHKHTMALLPLAAFLLAVISIGIQAVVNFTRSWSFTAMTNKTPLEFESELLIKPLFLVTSLILNHSTYILQCIMGLTSVEIINAHNAALEGSTRCVTE